MKWKTHLLLILAIFLMAMPHFVQGMDSSRLQPDGGATRAQVATILQRLCETVMK